MNQELLPALTRQRFDFFIRQAFATVSSGDRYLDNWHIDAIVHQLMRVRSGEIHRLLINQPPRSLKSICVSVAFVAWLLGHDPRLRILVVSYSANLAADLHRQFRMVVESRWYRAAFPHVAWTKAADLEYVTTKGGGRYAASVGGTLTGRGADLIIIDDPLNANEAESEAARRRVNDFYSGVLLSRLNDKKTGAIVAVMQRLHEDDLAGYFLRQGGWESLCLPAIATEEEFVDLGDGRRKRRRPGGLLHPVREDRVALDQIRAEVGSLRFSAQYQQQPVPPEGNLVKREWFRPYHTGRSDGRVVQSWDVACATGEKNDYSVCTTWRIVGRDYYLIDVWRGRAAYPDLRRKLISLAQEYAASTILIEEVSSGLSLLQDLRMDAKLKIVKPIGMRPDASKQDRVVASSAQIEAGHVHIPVDASWLPTFLNEVLAFPHGRHDDQVDSMSQFLQWAQRETFWMDQGADIGLPIQVY